MGSVSKWKTISGQDCAPEKELDLARHCYRNYVRSYTVDLIISFRDTQITDRRNCAILVATRRGEQEARALYL